MSALAIRRLRVLRRHRRPRLQAGVSGAQRPRESRWAQGFPSSAWGDARASISRSARASESLEQAGKFDAGRLREAGVAAALRQRRLLRPRDLQQAAQGARARQAPNSLSRDSAEHVRQRRARARQFRLRQGRARHRREALRPRSGDRAGARRHAARRCSPRDRSSASTTTSARRRCKISSIFASRTASSSPSGTASTCRTCRSPWRRASASRGGAVSTRKSVRSATWCRIICCR